MSTLLRKVPLQPAHGLTVAQVKQLRTTQGYWQNIIDAPHVVETAKVKARNEVAMIERMLGHG
jgi:hypothetical protein